MKSFIHGSSVFVLLAILEKEKAITTAFTPEAHALLSGKLGLNEYAVLLVDLYGMRTLYDLAELDSDVIDDIVKHVREGLFKQVDFESRATRIRYLGADFQTPEAFNFKPMDRKKLLKVNAAALEEITKQKELELTRKLLKSSANASTSTQRALTSELSNSSTQSTVLSDLDESFDTSESTSSSTQARKR